MLADAMLKLEIPNFPTFRAVVVRNDVNLSVQDISLKRRIAPSTIGWTTVYRRKTRREGVQERISVLDRLLVPIFVPLLAIHD